MKAKKFDRKLTLTRHTIANLDEKAMRKANGGIFTDTCFISICYCPYETWTQIGDKSLAVCCTPC